MAKTPGQILKAARLARRDAGDSRFKSAASAARAIGMDESTYRSYENGHRIPTPENAKVLGDAYSLDPKLLCPAVADLLGTGDGTSTIEIAGELAVGAWSDTCVASKNTSRLDTRVIHNTSGRRGRRRKAYKIVDESINKIFRPGWFAIVEEAHGASPLEFPDHSLLVVERVRNGLTERSVRRLERTESDRCELTCYSTEKRYLGDRVHFPPKNTNESVTIIGKVVGGSFDL
jgi:transcriptional regulator with XRE-family HTH domain